jgi:hypothetical protein
MRNSVVLPAPFGPTMPTMPPGGSLKDRPVHQELAVIGLGQALGLDHHAAEARARRDDDLRRLVLLFGLLGLAHQIVIGGDPRLGLGLAGPGGGGDPLPFRRNGAQPRFLLAAFLLQALLLLLQPGGIVALVGNAAAAVQFQDPARHIVQEVAVVGDHHDGARIVRQEALQPGDAFGVQMVGRLVQQQHVGAAQQQLHQRDAALFPAG